MTDEAKKHSEETISKALEHLQGLSKGHSSRGTSTTNVETMRDGSVGAGSDEGATQVYHTPSNSDPQTWAGTSQVASPDDGAADNVAENGTDYTGVSSSVMKSILEKLAKGQPLTAQEQGVYNAFAKGGYSKDGEDVDKATDDPDKKDRDEERMSEKEDDKSVGKSLSDHVQESDDMAKSLEVSEFLTGFVDANSRALNGSAQRVVEQVNKSIRQVQESQESFNSELAKGISALADVLALQSQRIEQLESTPAQGPRAQQAAAVEKSFSAGGAGTAGQEPELTKAQVENAMMELIEKGNLSPTEMIKFDTNKTLSPEMHSMIRAHVNGRG